MARKKDNVGVQTEVHQKSDQFAKSVMSNSFDASICKESQIGAKQSIMESITVTQMENESNDMVRHFVQSKTIQNKESAQPRTMLSSDTTRQNVNALSNKVRATEHTIIHFIDQPRKSTASLDRDTIVEQSTVLVSATLSEKTPGGNMPVKESASDKICSNGITVPLKNRIVDTESTLGIHSVVVAAGENQLIVDNAHDGQVIERDGKIIKGIVQQKVVSPDSIDDPVTVKEFEVSAGENHLFAK